MRRSGSTMQYLDSSHHSCSVRPWPLAVLALFRAFFKNWLRPQIMPEIAHSCQCCTDFFSLFQERVSPFWQHLKHDLPDWLQAFYRKNLWLDPKFAIWGGCPKTNETIWMRQAKQHDRHCCTNLMQFIFSGIRSCRKHGVYGCLWYVYGMSIRLSQCLNMFKSLRKCGKLMMQCLALPGFDGKFWQKPAAAREPSRSVSRSTKLASNNLVPQKRWWIIVKHLGNTMK